MGIRIGLGRTIIGQGNSLPSNWTPLNVVLAAITGGIRITWDADVLYETEIYVSVNQGTYYLVTTIALNTGIYDYMVDSGADFSFKLRFKNDTTVLNVPSGLSATPIANGATLNWTDTNGGICSYEVYADTGSGYVLVATTGLGATTYNYMHDQVHVTFKIRGKEGTLPVYSAYTNITDSLWIPFEAPAILNDGNTVAWYSSDELATITKDSGTGEVSRWNDKLGSGHDLLQTTATRKPIWSVDGILFDGVNDSMKTDPFTFACPIFVYGVVKQVTWQSIDVMFDGGTTSSVLIQQYDSSGKLIFFAGTFVATGIVAPLNSYFIVRALFNGASGKMGINDAITNRNVGSGAMGGITLCSQGSNPIVSNGNFQFKEMIFRKVSDNTTNETAIYNYLKTKYGL
jgi:hypothetical protein